jgi:hypothetical protein
VLKLETFIQTQKKKKKRKRGVIHIVHLGIKQSLYILTKKNKE